MGRKSKAQLALEEKERLEFSASNEDETADVDAVEVDITEHSTEGGTLGGLLDRATQNLKNAAPGKPSKTQRYRANKKAREGDFSSVIVSLLTLGISAWNAPQDVKPNDDEINAFSVPATKLLLRHVNLTGKLTQDAVDLIGMIAAFGVYRARTNSAWSKLRAEREAKEKQERAAVQMSFVGDSDNDGFIFPKHVTEGIDNDSP